ncbi:hypothetical protein SPRG_06149 [Saprolegnia parasitica CBS 223.65]|uniref:Uncharacterized protein n=1 Tax=Saprolegnia parasitica (strain CBS 223.65) TaxID=695850 RepID=A0A067CEB8_SAPPC|nr:hypothetical protein SPRG_06149 [Saprolegnia parasitica CBS 223.65]KDO29094.1 hypothetical protein SPRG_06149 [Saprolegnia parasitica CBS 223.65]|eukprot:XP_012200262.1 hypothetical protein SPRG_06149 [Saprolegnia parasitica CBS 223.65]
MNHLAPRGVYLSPYLTCAQCNALNVVNAHRLGPATALGRHRFQREVLPVCVGCGRTLQLRVGVTNHAPVFASQAAAFHHAQHIRAAAALTLQRIVRGGLARCDADRRRRAKAARDALECRAATLLQRRVRGMQTRRRTKIQSGVSLIAWTHERLLQTLLCEASAATARVFWFSDTEDLALIQRDYRAYVRRAGPSMTLRRFEGNVLLLVHRIWAMQHRMAARIQARWRGVQLRHVLRIYLCELGRLREVWHCCAGLIQRNWRRRCDHVKANRQRSTVVPVVGQRRRPRLLHDVRRVRAVYAQHHRHTDKVAGYLAHPHVKMLADNDVLQAFAATYGAMTSPAMQRHHAAHVDARRQIHAFVAKATGR